MRDAEPPQELLRRPEQDGLPRRVQPADLAYQVIFYQLIHEQVEIDRLEGIIEAILFTMGESVEIGKIALAIEHDEATIERVSKRTSVRTYFLGCLATRIRYSYISVFVLMMRFNFFAFSHLHLTAFLLY